MPKRARTYSDGEPFRRSKLGRWMQYDRKVGAARRAVKALVAAPAVAPKYRMTGMNISPFPAKKRTTVDYCATFALTPPVLSTNVVNNSFRFNSLFDPQISLGGHQPYGFDQWMAMYTRYTVISATATLVCNPTTASAYGGNFGMNISPSGAALVTGEETAIESQYSNWAPYNQTEGPKAVKLKLDVAKYFGVHDVMDDDTLSGTSLADASKIADLNCWVSGDLPSTPQSTFTLVIKYDVYFHEPREVGGS